MKRSVVLIVLGLFCAVGMGVSMLGLTASNSVQAGPTGVTYSTGPDGWRVANMPAPINLQQLGLPGLFTVSVRSRPVLNDLALPSVHPVARLLNTYWEVTAQPNLQAVAFNGRVTIDREARTANLPSQLTAQEKADLMAKTGVGQHFKNGMSTLGNSLLTVPLSILCLPALPFFVNEVKTLSRDRKQTLYRNQQTLLLDEAWQASGPWVQRLSELQQRFDLNSPQLTWPADPNRGVYNVLPNKPDYELDVTRRTVSFLPNAHPTVMLHFGLKQRTTAAQVETLLAQDKARTGRDTGFYVSVLQPDSETWVPAPDDKATIVLTECDMRLTSMFTDVSLNCNGRVD